MTDTPPSLIARGVGLLRGLVFDTAYDWLKAGFIALLAFGVGNFTGWFKPEPRVIATPKNAIGDYIEGYTFLFGPVDAYVADYEPSVSVVYDPPELEQVRYCSAPGSFTGYKETLFDQIKQATAGCLNFEIQIAGSQKIITATPGPALQRVEDLARPGLFCQCTQEVQARYLSDPDAP